MPTDRWSRVTEIPAPDRDLPLLVHPGWVERFPWLVQGTTHRGAHDFDLRLFGTGADAEAVRSRLRMLTGRLGMSAAVVSRQIHGADVGSLEEAPVGPGRGSAPGGDPPGVAPRVTAQADRDGHLTAEAGVLLCVTVADCVPVSLVDPGRRGVALLHAGWRGAAAGILERGLAGMEAELGVRPDELHLHLGPSICGDCYEVGPEVFRALGRPEPDVPAPIDLRTALAERAAEAGVRPGRITISTHCTLHGDAPLYSHRGGDRGRQLGLLGVGAER